MAPNKFVFVWLVFHDGVEIVHIVTHIELNKQSLRIECHK